LQQQVFEHGDLDRAWPLHLLRK